MRLLELTESPNNNLITQIINSMVLTIIDPKLKGARKADCYTFCAKAIRNEEVPDDAEFAIYGVGKHPAHGVIQRGDEILTDVFSNHRTMFKDGVLKYHVEGYAMSDHPLKLVYKVSVADMKKLALNKYNQIKNI